MERKFFNIRWAGLLAAFPNSKVTSSSQNVYWEMLQDIPEGWFDEGVRHCLSERTFFPTIHELGRASVPLEEGGGRMNCYTYVPEFEVPWPRTLAKEVRRIELKGVELKAIEGGKKKINE